MVDGVKCRTDDVPGRAGAGIASVRVGFACQHAFFEPTRHRRASRGGWGGLRPLHTSSQLGRTQSHRTERCMEEVLALQNRRCWLRLRKLLARRALWCSGTSGGATHAGTKRLLENYLNWASSGRAAGGFAAVDLRRISRQLITTRLRAAEVALLSRFSFPTRTPSRRCTSSGRSSSSSRWNAETQAAEARAVQAVYFRKTVGGSSEPRSSTESISAAARRLRSYCVAPAPCAQGANVLDSLFWGRYTAVYVAVPPT